MKFSNKSCHALQGMFCDNLSKFKKNELNKQQIHQLKGGQDYIGIVDLVDG